MWLYRVGLRWQKNRNNCCIAVHSSSNAIIAHRLWAHIGSIPWATSKSTASQLALWRGASINRTARNLFTPWPRRFWPFHHRLAQSNWCVWVHKSISHNKKCLSRARPPFDLRDTSHCWLHGRLFSLTQGQQRCARSNYYSVLCPVDLGLSRRVSGALSQNRCEKKLKEVWDEGCRRVLLFDILS